MNRLLFIFKNRCVLYFERYGRTFTTCNFGPIYGTSKINGLFSAQTHRTWSHSYTHKVFSAHAAALIFVQRSLVSFSDRGIIVFQFLLLFSPQGCGAALDTRYYFLYDSSVVSWAKNIYCSQYMACLMFVFLRSLQGTHTHCTKVICAEIERGNV